MAQDINQVMIIGRLTRDAEIRSTNGGKEIASFSVAVNRSVKRGDQWSTEVSFFDVQKWSPGGVAPYLSKGQQVGISGELRQDRWEHEGKNYSKVLIHCNSLQLLSSPKGSSKQKSEPDQGSWEDDFEDDIPF